MALFSECYASLNEAVSRPNVDRRARPQFRGSAVISDAGLLAYREPAPHQYVDRAEREKLPKLGRIHDAVIREKGCPKFLAWFRKKKGCGQLDTNAR
jgi:hypothetical protein